MIERAYIHVAGSAGAGKTAFVEAVLRGLDADILAARCVRDDALREARESAPKGDAELWRFRAAGASGVARYAFPGADIGSDAFFMTDLMADYSQAVLIEGDSPVEFATLRVFVARPAGHLFVRRKRDRAKEERAKARAWERLLRTPEGPAQLLGAMINREAIDLLAARNPHMLEETRQTFLRGLAQIRKAPPPPPAVHWTVAPRYAGIEQAQLVVFNVQRERERARGMRLAAELARLRTDDELFTDVLGVRGSRVPITIVVADLADAKDPGTRKAVARVRRASCGR